MTRKAGERRNSCCGSWSGYDTIDFDKVLSSSFYFLRFVELALVGG
jgi:hypothetical protein